MDAEIKQGKSKDKHQRFCALAESRTNKAIEAILRIGNLSNRQIYEFEEPEVRKVIRALKDAVSLVESRLSRHAEKVAADLSYRGAKKCQPPPSPRFT
jgi:hypothetical protein